MVISNAIIPRVSLLGQKCVYSQGKQLKYSIFSGDLGLS